MKKRYKISTVRIVSIGFVAIILLGAALLSMPFSSQNCKYTDFTDALFTSTSAVCVTGLSVVNTEMYWSFAGKVIILILIQTGGLGFMTIATLLSFALRRKISLKERMLLAESLNQEELSGVVRLTSNVIKGTFLFEFIGAFILTWRFCADYPFDVALWKGIFHSISAFCNAGFDLFGNVAGNNSFALYSGDIIINLTLIFLIIMGGLGFFAWTDLINVRSLKKMHTHTKIVLLITVILTFGGAFCIFFFELSNPNTSGMSIYERIITALFQSVTCRTAGFETISQADFGLPARLLSGILMFIGGSPGSTAGGIKTVTFAVLVMSSVSFIRGRQDTNMFKRRIPPEAIRRAISLVMLGVFAVAVATIAISLFETTLTLDEILFEVVSAFATVGLSCGITASLGGASRLILIILMCFGRIGILTIGMALAEKHDKGEGLYRYADAHISVG